MYIHSRIEFRKKYCSVKKKFTIISTFNVQKAQITLKRLSNLINRFWVLLKSITVKSIFIKVFVS